MAANDLKKKRKSIFMEDEFANELYDCLFHYNRYKGKWHCFKRGEKREYFNGDTQLIGEGRTVTDAFFDFYEKDLKIK